MRRGRVEAIDFESSDLLSFAMMYCADKVRALQTIFGVRDIEVKTDRIRVAGMEFPVVDDVIDLLATRGRHTGLAEDIQFTLGAEWREHGQIFPEHAAEFAQYFELVDLASLKDARVCDLGRWNFFLKDTCRELVLVDFSDAIHVARRNLRGTAPLTAPVPRRRPISPETGAVTADLPLLRLDNRPWFFRALLRLVNVARRVPGGIRSPLFRKAFAWAGAVDIYRPLVAPGTLLRAFGLDRSVPLSEVYRGKSLKRNQQDVYDRFFTRIEQRVSRAQIGRAPARRSPTCVFRKGCPTGTSS